MRLFADERGTQSASSNDQPVKDILSFYRNRNLRTDIRARQPLGPPTHVACITNIIIAHRQAQNSPRPKRKAYQEVAPRHNSSGVLYCKQSPRLQESFDPTRIVSISPSQDVLIESVDMVPFVCSTLFAMRSGCSLASWKPAGARGFIGNPTSA